MTKVLVIQAHPHIDNSLSLTVGKEFVEDYKKSHPNDEVVIRDLFTEEGVPALNNVTMTAWKKQKFGQEMTDEEKETIKKHDEWLDEFISADKYIFINPMYNHFMPAEMKQYLDLTAIARKTFKYTPEGAVGLLTGKKAMHIQATGGKYHSEDANPMMDLGSVYLTKMLNFYGINDVDNIFIEGADENPEKRQEILEKALQDAQAKAPKF